MGIEQEAREGLLAYRNSLIDAFEDTEISVDPDEIRAALSAEGIESKSPIITIPYTIEALEKAVATKNDSEWNEPATASRLEDALEKRKRLANGESMFDVGYPKLFYSSLLDVSVVIDESDVCGKAWGETYAKADFLVGFAHEVTHSAFARLTNLSLTPIEGTETLRVVEKSAIGQYVTEEVLERGGGTEQEYQPVWIDEAFAVHASAAVRARLYPESITAYSYTFTGDNFETPPHYLIPSVATDESPGDVAGSIVGIGLEVLDSKRPGSIDKIKQLARGKMTIDKYYCDLRNSVGTELYADMTERQPVTTWNTTLDRIKEL